jgi:sugar lactone lactonase YvrE
MPGSYDLEWVIQGKNALGEGPLWDPTHNRLYWVDIEGHQIFCWQPLNQHLDNYTFPLAITALGLRRKGGLVLATRDGFATWDFSNLDWIADPESNKPEARFNDGTVDCQGRFWAGTMTETGATSSLYRLDPDGKVTTMETHLTISNGLGWSPDLKTFYLTDTVRQKIYAYDFDPELGDIENRRIFIDVAPEHGSPDGLAMDAQGFIWSCCWGGWKILRIDPSGQIEREILLPVEHPTSCVFAGADFSDLYVTSARSPVKNFDRQPSAGGLLHIKTEFHGLPPHEFAG